ncbi:hypothetical protein EV2_009375 [Malus domestica]
MNWLPCQKGRCNDWRRSGGPRYREWGRGGSGSLRERDRFRRREQNSLCPSASPAPFSVTGSISGSLRYLRLMWLVGPRISPLLSHSLALPPLPSLCPDTSLGDLNSTE